MQTKDRNLECSLSAFLKKIMPANLNALIRYKTIDQCLSNQYRNWTIQDLVEACSSALGENRGIYKTISERTIRDDIRVMRSDILGFNAPIVQKKGEYYYKDPTFSIFSVNISSDMFIKRIYEFLNELREEVDHPKLEIIIEKVGRAIPPGKRYPSKPPSILSSIMQENTGIIETDEEIEQEDFEKRRVAKTHRKVTERFGQESPAPPPGKTKWRLRKRIARAGWKLFTWKEILETI